MMIDRLSLKMDAKAAMREAHTNPYVVTLIPFIISVVGGAAMMLVGGVGGILSSIFPDVFYSEAGLVSISAVWIIVFVIYYVVSVILQYGYQLFCLKVSRRDETAGIGDLFSLLPNFFKIMGLMIVTGFFIFLWSLLFFIPGIIASIRYSQAVFIFLDDPKKGILECIDESKQLMRGRILEYFILALSFILWGLLVSVTFGLASLYVTPYSTVTYANYYNFIRKNHVSNL